MEHKTEVLPARKKKLPAELGSLSRNITPDEYRFSIVLLDGRTDRHHVVSSRFSQFRERAVLNVLGSDIKILFSEILIQ
jgi:hypothetical protein